MRVFNSRVTAKLSGFHQPLPGSVAGFSARGNPRGSRHSRGVRCVPLTSRASVLSGFLLLRSMAGQSGNGSRAQVEAELSGLDSGLEGQRLPCKGPRAIWANDVLIWGTPGSGRGLERDRALAPFGPWRPRPREVAAQPACGRASVWLRGAQPPC